MLIITQRVPHNAIVSNFDAIDLLESDGFTENKDFSLPLQRLYCAVLYLFSACIEASDA